MSNQKYADRLEGYIQVNDRITAFHQAYPEGSLQTEIIEMSDTKVVVKAFAFRTPDDVRPGIGHAALAIPGLTPYTRGSELENAETSAWGRALAALGFEIRRSIASVEEISSKKGEEPASQEVSEPRPFNLNIAQVQLVNKSFKAANENGQQAMKGYLKARGYTSRQDFFERGNDVDFNGLVDEFNLLEQELVESAS